MSQQRTVILCGRATNVSTVYIVYDYVFRFILGVDIPIALDSVGPAPKD